MLCSICNKNTAVIFVNKQLPDKSFATEGLCYECAKKKGINPLDALSKQANLSEDDVKDMANQIENMFKDMSENIDMDSIIGMEVDGENFDESGSPMGAIPLGSIFSNMFGMKNNSEGQTTSDKKKVKVEKKPKEKKKKALDTFGTNLTFKARNNELDSVVGRNREIQRIVQILNRRSKNNPCLIGEPGVGKTAIAQGLAIKIAKRQCSCKTFK